MRERGGVATVGTFLQSSTDLLEERVKAYLPEILSFLTGVLAGWSIKVKVSGRRDSSNTVTQTGNTVGGDQAGHDLRK